MCDGCFVGVDVDWYVWFCCYGGDYRCGVCNFFDYGYMICVRVGGFFVDINDGCVLIGYFGYLCDGCVRGVKFVVIWKIVRCYI